MADRSSTAAVAAGTDERAKTIQVWWRRSVHRALSSSRSFVTLDPIQRPITSLQLENGVVVWHNVFELLQYLSAARRPLDPFLGVSFSEKSMRKIERLRSEFGTATATAEDDEEDDVEETFKTSVRSILDRLRDCFDATQAIEKLEELFDLICSNEETAIRLFGDDADLDQVLQDVFRRFESVPEVQWHVSSVLTRLVGEEGFGGGEAVPQTSALFPVLTEFEAFLMERGDEFVRAMSHYIV